MTLSSTTKIFPRNKQWFLGTVCNMRVAYYVHFAVEIRFCCESD